MRQKIWYADDGEKPTIRCRIFGHKLVDISARSFPMMYQCTKCGSEFKDMGKYGLAQLGILRTKNKCID